MCNECDDIFHPLQDSSSDDGSSGFDEEHDEEPDPADLVQARRDFMLRSRSRRGVSTDDNSQVVMEEEEREQVRAALATLVLNAFNNLSVDLTTSKRGFYEVI